MDSILIAQFGVSGATICILLYIIKELWQDLRETRKQAHEDQRAMLPALEAASQATKSALEEIIKLKAISEYEGR